jgi:hypothetical protein
MASLLRIISISINRVLGKIFAGASAFMIMFIIMVVEMVGERGHEHIRACYGERVHALP